MESVLAVNPFRCRMWHMHDRLEEHISEGNCSAEIQSFEDHGQLVPVLGRRINDGSDHDIELIYGARRLFVARHINKPLLVEVRDLSDREAIIAMDLENRQRKDISPYERALSYARWLRAGYFESQEDMARILKISQSQVSRYLKMARLPSVIVNAFGSAVDICEGWGLDLIEVLENPQTRRPILRKAREIAETTPRPAARDVYRQLLGSAAPGRKPRRLAHDKVVKDQWGNPLFRVREQRNAILLILPIEKVSARCLDAIQEVVEKLLQDHPARVSVSSGNGERWRDASLPLHDASR